MKRFAGPLAIAGLAMFLASAASAQAPLPPEQKYYNYQEAVFAYEGCRKVQFTQDQFNRLYQRVEELVGVRTPPTRSLALIQEAKTDIRRAIAYRGGCANPQVVQALSLFQRDLAPAAGL